MVTRVFVGWQQPFAKAAADYLLTHAETLPETLVITPTNQAGRQLLRLMASRQGAILSPRLSTPGGLLQTPDIDIATPWIERLAWQQTLESQTDWSPALFPEAPPAGNDWAGNLAAEMVRLRRKLQENGLTLQSAARRLTTSVEADRWQALADLEQAMEQQLRQWKFRSRSRVLAGGVNLPGDLKSIILAGVTELPPLLARTLEDWSGDVTCLIAAPADHADDFSPLGIPLDRWSELPIPWPEHGGVHLCADIRQQAQRTVDCLINANTPPEETAIGCADIDSGEALKQVLAEFGWIAHHPAATKAPAGLTRWLKIWSTWLKEPKLSVLMDLLALPETQTLIQDDRGMLAEQLSGLRNDRIIIQADDLRHLIQQDQFRNDIQRRISAQALRTIETLEQWRAMCLRHDFIESHLRLLDQLSSHSDITRSQAVELADWLEQAAPLAAHVGRPATFWIDLLLDEQSPEPQAPPDGRIIDIQGWLELLFCPGKHLVVCGMNEGIIPGSQSGDPWLGEAAKSQLGLLSDHQRATRDAFLMRSMIESRLHEGRTDLICAKTKANGEALLPSRLLLAADDHDLPERVKPLFTEVEPPDARLRWQTEWKWTPPQASIPERFSATSLRDYLACPFRFFLKHILHMHDTEPDRVEWNARDFGNTAHAILDRWGKDPEARELSNAASLKEWLVQALEETIHQQFGSRLPMAVRIQSESLRQRLHWFAEQQALIRAQGWQVMHTEREFKIQIGNSTLKGIIDRIDHHPENQQWRVIDYKTGKDKGTAAAHQTRMSTNTRLPAHISENCPVIYTRTENQKSPQSVRWTNLQLPLYALALQREQAIDATPCYFKLGETASQVQLDPWDDFSHEDASAAEQCAQWIIERIHQGVFGPPAESVAYDDFESLCAGRPIDEVFDIQAQPAP